MASAGQLLSLVSHPVRLLSGNEQDLRNDGTRHTTSRHRHLSLPEIAMLGEGVLEMGGGNTVSSEPRGYSSHAPWPLSALQDYPPSWSNAGKTGLTSPGRPIRTVDVAEKAGGEDIPGGELDEGQTTNWHSTPISSGRNWEGASRKQFVLRFRRNDSMPECEFLESDSPRTPQQLPSLAETEDESASAQVTAAARPKAFTLRLNSNDSMPECLLLSRRLSSPSTTSDELSPTLEEEEEEEELEEEDSVHDTSHSTLVAEDGVNPYHTDKELFFPVPDIDMDSFTPSSPNLSSSQSSKGKKVIVNGQEIALFYHNAQLYAVDEKCPHLGGPLHLGDIEDIGATESPRIVCPWHKWCFELATGKQVRPEWRHNSIQSYPVRIDPISGSVAIGFKSINPSCFDIVDDF